MPTRAFFNNKRRGHRSDQPRVVHAHVLMGDVALSSNVDDYFLYPVLSCGNSRQYSLCYGEVLAGLASSTSLK